MDKLLVVGADSILGANLALSLCDHFEVIGLAASPISGPAGCRIETVDLRQSATVCDYLRRESPAWVIHCGPLATSAWETPPDDWQQGHPAELAQAVAGAAAAQGCPVAILTSDAVFRGPRLFHEERCRTTGEHPLAAEMLRCEAAAVAAGALVVRTHAYGWSPAPERTCGFVEAAWNALANGQPLALDADRHATPILASDLAALLERAYERHLTGVYHITGAERVSQVRFVHALAAAAGLSAPAAAQPRGKAGLIEETSLNTSHARRDLAAAMPLVREGLARLVEQRTSGYRDRLLGAKPAAARPAELAA